MSGAPGRQNSIDIRTRLLAATVITVACVQGGGKSADPRMPSPPCRAAPSAIQWIRLGTDHVALSIPAQWSIDYSLGKWRLPNLVLAPQAGTERLIIRAIPSELFVPTAQTMQDFLITMARTTAWPATTQRLPALRRSESARSGCILAVDGDVAVACGAVRGSVVVYAHIVGLSSGEFDRDATLALLRHIIDSAALE